MSPVVSALAKPHIRDPLIPRHCGLPQHVLPHGSMQAHLNDHCAGPLVGDVSAAYLAQHSLGPARCVGSWFPAGSMACTFAVGLKAGPILLGHNPNPLNQPAVGPNVWPGKFFRKPVPFPDFMASCAVSMSFSILVFSSKQGHLVVRNIVISKGPRQRRRAPVLTSRRRFCS